ncbi:MAG: aminoglycoside phosphotransferase family protein [Eubacteriales bacterium]|nr:aminoglycoside phosphotransferase family protein [Eubacteriales bacterium]
MDKEALVRVAEHFFPAGSVVSVEGWGNGHINETYLVKLTSGEKMILQKINQHVFPKPEELMENMMGITSYLQKIIAEQGGDPRRETLNVIPELGGKSCYRDENGEYWRVTRYIDHAVCFDQVESPEDFYESARAFGKFQNMLSGYPAESLHETIERFHDTRARFAAFKKAVDEDVMGRAAEVQEEIRFVLEREETANYFSELLEQKKLPLRVTHNDTKLNNIMMDPDTRKGVCVIDLDTVMPGLAMNDFGDSIRFGASTAAEDEQDLSKVSCDMGLFEIYTKGFLEECREKLSPLEISLLPMGAKVMTYECGMRFLMDHLQGDIYFRIHRPGQNLDRARTQFCLVADMEKKWDTMQQIVRKYGGKESV